jgi:hypothetical protein
MEIIERWQGRAGKRVEPYLVASSSGLFFRPREPQVIHFPILRAGKHAPRIVGGLADCGVFPPRAIGLFCRPRASSGRIFFCLPPLPPLLAILQGLRRGLWLPQP